jgi:predicted transcriptional regulator
LPRPVPHNRMQIKERREDVLVLLTKGMKAYEIAKELGVDASTVSRDIQYLISQSHNYLNNLAKETLPFMYRTSIEGIRNVLNECWKIYTLDNHNSNKDLTWFHKIAALKLAKECYAMKLELLTNATVVDDAIRFIASHAAPIERANSLHILQHLHQQKKLILMKELL